MTAVLTGFEAPDARAVSIRYFNLYRIVVASAFAIFGGVLSFGQKAPDVFIVAVVAYWVMAFTFFLLHAGSPHYGERTLGLQAALDIIVLAMFMYASGGYRSGVPFLMMTSIAGSGLIGQGRMVLGAASLATIAVLIDQAARMLSGERTTEDLPQAAIVCIGFFAVAIVARMLARRALANEALARERGLDLARQLRVNARIIEDMQEGVVVVDERGRIRQANPRAAELLGVRLDVGSALSACVPALEAGAVLHVETDFCVHIQNEQTGASLQVRRLATGEGADLLFYVEDTERVLARARQMKLAALGRLTANIAHEIRNPLSSISHAGELLLEEKRGEVQQRLVRIIHDNTARIERIVRDVLELGRRDRLTSERLELGQFCRTFLEEYALQHADVMTLVVLDVPQEVWVNFDRVHLYQILSNLLGNARRYCCGQPGSIHLNVQRLDEARGLFTIRDDGPGIPSEDRSKVFEPFFTSDPKGTGLGLYMARELAEANAADLSLLDAAGGAEFHLIVRRLHEQ
ncbi:sensor histidine kinase [Uliginosibacterium aquaticum]|uniref:histidine kinase n=1 Tax=Uliginosibacterium aquaticum TaxID=2731212 RepID=A0ABX2IGE8_9RHOO|nr:PAS domain-containing sensor histidine kinase [Uliginosibacterium aquaticum]NSL55562.1 PAS domain-containing protein [Uliginosibacterium aquaticum]